MDARTFQNRARFLAARQACPKCGATALERHDGFVRFECAAAFGIDANARISCVYPCPEASMLTAKLWNAQTAEDGR
ncbi:hypothetical protein [Rhizobium sp. CSW-27]|uniref:hypothetical protein n=1 Tax=Rhizobium sp. CSW-27 TaxID=2839985 RepID=UPI001C02EDF3|nr:hypothetical protein [Rhizobium sp. CSW-27]MBT9370292.1 hypothetical protein [Rhizobium sp. CSW-27]